MRDPEDPWGGGGEPLAPPPSEPARSWHLTPDAIARCTRCDESGYWNGHVCDHGAGAAAAERCRGLVREALKKERECIIRSLTGPWPGPLPTEHGAHQWFSLAAMLLDARNPLEDQ